MKTFLHIVVLVLFLITDDIVSSQYLVKVGLSHQVVIYGLVVSKLRLGELNLRSIQFEYRTLAHFITLPAICTAFSACITFSLLLDTCSELAAILSW